MDKNAIKKYAIWARRELIEKVSQKALQYGIEDGKELDPKLESINGVLLTDDEKKQRQALIRKINENGYTQVMEEVAYTWFNRFIALRFMEVNGYLPSHVRVFTDEVGEFKPQIMSEALHLEIEGLDMEKVYELKNDNKDDDLFKYLLITQCNALSGVLPKMFQKIADYTELLLPDYLLREGSVIEQMVNQKDGIPEADWQDQVQIIGWLYQYYNTEPKADIDAKVKKGIKVSKNELPAKTQIFTPDWVVKYMVENSLGKLWNDYHQSSNTSKLWRYYSADSAQSINVQNNLKRQRERYTIRTPKDIECIDPCMGSGHILCYLFDVLIEIYKEYGYTASEAVKSIIENNIYGLDIDNRAAQLAYFSVMMKARKYDRRFLTRKDEDGNPIIPQPHVYAISESNLIEKQYIDDFVKNDNKLKGEIEKLIRTMRDAKEYGSLISVENIDLDYIEEAISLEKNNITLLSYYLEDYLNPLIDVARLLIHKYDIVCTNPPYLGGGGMSDKMSDFARENYPLSKNDLFAIFIERGMNLTKPGMYNCMVTMQSWMFLSSYEKLRRKLIDNYTVTNLLHMDNQVMGIAFGTAVTVFRSCYIDDYCGTYCYVYNSDIIDGEPREFPVLGNRYAQVSSKYYEGIPGSPIAYWISERTRDSFMQKDTIGTIAPPKQGLATADNNRFLRLWHEVQIDRIGFGMDSCESALVSGKKWFPYNKGGAFQRWYGNRNYVVNWENDGYEIKNFKDEKGKLRSRPQNIQYYFKPAITWSDVTSGSFSGRYAEKGFMFDIKGSSGFPDERLLPYILGLLNSKVAQAFIKILNPTMTTQVGDMTRIPVICSDEWFDKVTDWVNECIDMVRQDCNSFETSWDFENNPLLLSGENNLEQAYYRWESDCNKRFRTILENEKKINRAFISIYGLENELDADVSPDNITVHQPSMIDAVKELISYAVGCMFGRYSLDTKGLVYAGGEWDASAYSSFEPDVDGIIPICNDDYFEDDILNRFVLFLKIAFGEDTLDDNLSFIGQVLGGNGTPRERIRQYFIEDFYNDHCANYSIIGSGQRPIYWLFDSGKNNGFKCLIYIHRYKPDTIARIRTDYVHEQQARYKTAIEEIENRINSVSSSEKVKLTKKLNTLIAQDEEIHVYEEKIHHLADQMINIDLDDGVKHNYALFQDVLAKKK